MKKSILIGISIITVAGILLAAIALGFGTEQPSPEPTLTVTQITGSITATTPRAPGFGATLAIGILYTIYLFKRRYN